VQKDVGSRVKSGDDEVAMCIACELGYWAMVDALEAERNAAKKNNAVDHPAFSCEPDVEEAEPSPAPRVQRTADEPAP
jgi:hypothetical protein